MLHRLRPASPRAISSDRGVRNGPPDAVRMMRSTASALLDIEALEDRVVLGIDRQQGRPVRAGPRRCIEIAGADQRFLVGERDDGAAPHRRQRRREARGADDRRHHPIGRPVRRLDHGLAARPRVSMPVPASASFSAP